MNSVGQAIFDACSQMDVLSDRDDFFLGSAIPDKKLSNLSQECANAGSPMAGDEIIAIIDCTVFGSCKNGLAIGGRGVYTHNDSSDSLKNGFVSWSEFVANAFIRKDQDGFSVMFVRGRRTGICLAGSDVTCDDCVQLFERIHKALEPLLASLASSNSNASTQVRVPTGSWTCSWCGRTNTDSANCQGCGAPASRS